MKWAKDFASSIQTQAKCSDTLRTIGAALLVIPVTWRKTLSFISNTSEPWLFNAQIYLHPPRDQQTDVEQQLLL